MKNPFARALAGLAGALLLAWPIQAPAAAPPQPAPVSVLAGQTSLSVTNASARVVLPSTAASAISITILNSGTKDAYFAQGGSSVTATTASTLIKAGSQLTVWVSGTYVAAITGGSDTTTLIVYQANGPLSLNAPPTVGAGSGTVTSITAGTGLSGGTITTSGTIALLPSAAGVIGGVNSKAVVSHNFLTGIGTDGSISQAQPASSDLSDASNIALINANNALTGNNSLAGSFTLSGRTDATIAADQNNWTPTGTGTYANSSEVFVDGGVADRNITGMTGGAAGRIVGIVNKGTTNAIIIKNQSGSSSAANQFLLPADVTLPPNTALEMRYDGTASAWRPWGRALANTGVTAGSYTYASVTVDVSGRVTAASSGSAPASAANPTATIGAAAVNGSASTYMRSDAAPALPATLPNLNIGTPTGGTLTNTTGFPAGSLAGSTLAAGITASSLTSVGTLTGGATGAGFTIALSTSTVTGSLADARLSANVPLLNIANILTGNLTVSGASFGLSGNISAPTWTTSGVRYKNVAGTLTDTTAATGTTATAYTDVWGGNTIAATNASVVFTNYFGAYFKAPSAGTNVTLTNPWGLGADSLSVGTSNPFTVSAAGAVTANGLITATGGIRAGTSNVRIDIGNNSGTAIGLSSDARLTFQSTSSVATGSVDTGVSRVSPGITGFGTGAAGSIAGGIQAATVALGGATIGTDALAGTGTFTFSGAGTAAAFIPSGSTVPTNGMYLSAANTLNIATNSTLRVTISSTGAITFSNNLTVSNNLTATNALLIGTGSIGQWASAGVQLAGGATTSQYVGFASGGNATGTKDAFITSLAAATIQVGAIPNATPVANALLIGESSRSGTDSNVSGASGTIKSGNGTGNATPSSLTFQTPVAVASGTGAQTQTTQLSLNSTSATFVPYILSSTGIAVGTAGATPTANELIIARSDINATVGIQARNADTTNSTSLARFDLSAGAGAAAFSMSGFAGSAAILGTLTSAALKLQTNNTDAITISTAQLVTLSGQLAVTSMTQTSAAQSGTVCYNSGTGAVNYDATLGCLTSLEETKNILANIGGAEALALDMKLKPIWFSYKPGPGVTDVAPHAGLGAHATEAVDARLIAYNAKGALQGVRYADSITSLNVAAIQYVQGEFQSLQDEVIDLKKTVADLKNQIYTARFPANDDHALAMPVGLTN
jgi:hypothetical protein